MIKVFPPGATDFSTNGDGILADAASCVVEQKLNGSYELKLTYPANGRRVDSLVLRGLLVSTVDYATTPQAFRIYKITKPLNGIITVYARHLAYDLQGIVLNPFIAADLTQALQGLSSNASTTCPFTFTSTRTVSSPFSVTRPYDIWSVLAGQAGSLLDVYGGEYEFNNFSVELHSRRGADRGVLIAYGKNLTAYSQEQNNAAVYTGVYPFWADETTTITLPERIISAPGTYDFERILSLDLSAEFVEPPEVAALRDRATAYITANDIGVPKISWTLGFAEISEAGVDSRIYLGDSVSVRFPLYNVTASARVVGIKWNPLLERYDSISLGSVKTNFAEKIAAQAKAVERLPTVTIVETISSSLAKALMGASGGAVRLLDTNGDGMPDELYIADDPDPASAVKVWRWNYNGWAASSSGYAGPFVMGATLEDGILANAITAANLKAGTIESADGTTFFLDLDNGVLRMDVTSLSLNGEGMDVIIQGVADDAAKATSDVQNSLDALKAHIVVGNDGSMTFIGADQNPITLKLVNDQLGIYNGGTLIDSFAASGTTTQNLIIPAGGSFSMGNFKWAPRSSGALDLVWVG